MIAQKVFIRKDFKNSFELKLKMIAEKLKESRFLGIYGFEVSEFQMRFQNYKEPRF
jgi:hypothetical protein